PHRVLMAEFPAGSRIIPNPYNRIAAFAIRNHHFFPGFPEMAWPMLDWVLDTWLVDLSRERPIEKTVVVYDAGESQLMPLMDAITADYPEVKLFSLPTFMTEGKRRLELGVRGPAADVERAVAALHGGGVEPGGRWEHVW